MVTDGSLPTPKTLHPGIEKPPKRSFLSTISLMFAGWLIGNLIFLVTVLLAATIITAGSGLINVPYLTNIFFNKSSDQMSISHPEVSHTADSKIASLSALPEGSQWPLMEFTETELSYYLNNLIASSDHSVLKDGVIKILGNKIILKGEIAQTGAPVIFEGNININSYKGSVQIINAKVGKFDLPPALASKLLDFVLNSIGFDLEKSALPIGNIQIKDGRVVLYNIKPIR